MVRHLAERGAIDAEILAEYESYDTSATDVHASKQEHHETVLFLASAIGTDVEQKLTEESTIPVP